MVDPDLTEGLQHALTFGIEHTYEAVLEYGFDRKPYDAYGYLTQNIDYIFDNQKHKRCKSSGTPASRCLRGPIPAEELSGRSSASLPNRIMNFKKESVL